MSWLDDNDPYDSLCDACGRDLMNCICDEL